MDRNMAWAPHPHHRRGHSLGGGAVREKDEDLALFKDIGKRDKPAPFLNSSTDAHLLDAASLSTKFGGLSHPYSAAAVERKGIGAELLNSDADKTDYDWLMTPPGTPLFPSLDADSTALQQGALMNRSLAAIKTSRVGTAPRARSPAPNVNRGNPSPSRRPSTPQAGQPTAPTRSQSQRVAATNSSNRPATPTRSSTPSSRASPSAAQATRPSTPVRQQSSAPRPVTPLGARPATPTRRPATPTNSSSRASNCTAAATPTPTPTPTLRRSISSSTSRRNPSPTRSTGSTATSTAARGASPARSSSSVRGVSPAPTSRGRSPSPSLRPPYPVDASDDIPPNLRTTSDRPSSAQRRALAYGASPGEGRSTGSAGDPLRRTISPARSITPSSGPRDRASRASSDSESSFDNCSQSGLSNYGLATPERSGSRGRVFGHAPGVDYARSSSGLQQKVRRSAGATTTSPQFGPSVSKKSFESAAREYHRGQVAAFRPLMTNSSISTFYSSRASGLLRRPLTPSSTASSSEHGATVAHDSDEDVGSSHWKPASAQQASGTHSPLHLFDKSLRDAHGTGILSLDASIVDNDELGSFFTAPEPLQAECMDFQAGSHRKEIELEPQELARSAELNWLTARNEHEDSEYLRPGDMGKDVDTGKQGPSGLEKIRDKLRHLKSTADNEEAESASRAQSVTDSLCSLRAPSALEICVVDGDVTSGPLQGDSCDLCDCRKLQGGGETGHGCHNCSAALTATTSQTLQRHEGKSGRPKLLAEASSRMQVENAESSDAKSDNMGYGKERDIWYIYRHSSEYEVQVAGYSESKMEIDPPQILAKEVHTRTSPTSVGAQRESTSHERENTSPTPYVGESSGHKGNAAMETISTEASGGERLVSSLTEVANVALKGKEVDEPTGRLAGIGDVDCERQGLEEAGSQEGGAEQKNLKQVPCEPERANDVLVLDTMCENESTRASSSSEKPSKPLQNSRTPALAGSSLVAQCANTVPQRSSEAAEELEISVHPASQGGGQEEHDLVRCSQGSPVKNVALLAEEERHFNEEVREKAPLAVCTEVPWNEDHASVKKVIWQEEDLQPRTQLGSRPEAGAVQSRADERERTCPEGDEEKFGWGKGNVEDIIFVAGYHRDGSVEPQSQVTVTHEQNSTCTDDSGSVCFEPVELVGRKYLLTGEVHIDSALYATTHLFHDSLLIEVQSSDGRVLALDNPARLISEPDDVNSYAVYEYSHWAEEEEQLTFSAHHERKEGNLPSEILFHPKEHHVRVSKDEKQPRIPEFQGRLRMQVKGPSVVPALDGVQIPVVAEKEIPAGALKAGEISAPTVTDTTYLSQAAVAGSPPKKRNPELLLKTPDACEVQLQTAEAEENDAAQTGVRETEVRYLPSRNGEFEQSKPKELNNCKGAEQSLGASLHQTTTTADHFEYIFDSPGSKKAPAAGMLNSPTYAIANPDSGLLDQSNGIPQGSATKSQVYQSAVKMSPVSQNSKSTPRADSAPPVVMAVKEEIVENAESPSPGATRKHMSSFKFSHRKSTNSEPKRSSTTLASSASKLGITIGNGPQQSEQSPGSKKHMNNKASVNGKLAASSPSPQLNKGRSVRAPSPARPLATARPSEAAAGGHGEVLLPEEPSIHSRFSNITVRSGSDTENFDWGPSSLEETSSRCGSSEGANPATMAVLSPQFACHEGNHMANGDHVSDRDEDAEDDEEASEQEHDQQQQGSHLTRRHPDPANGRTVTNPRDSVPLEIFIPAAGHGPVRGGPASSTSTSSVINHNYAPKQNLDKLSEKLEQLETFGARVLLRNPEQQFMHSPPRPRHGHGHGHGHDSSPSSKKKQPDGPLEEAEEDRVYIPRPRQESQHTLRLDSGARSARPVDMKMSPLPLPFPSKRSNMCRCTIL